MPAACKYAKINYFDPHLHLLNILSICIFVQMCTCALYSFIIFIFRYRLPAAAFWQNKQISALFVALSNSSATAHNTFIAGRPSAIFPLPYSPVHLVGSVFFHAVKTFRWGRMCIVLTIRRYEGNTRAEPKIANPNGAPTHTKKVILLPRSPCYFISRSISLSPRPPVVRARIRQQIELV